MRHAASTSVACIILATKVIKTFQQELADLSTKFDHVILCTLYFLYITPLLHKRKSRARNMKCEKLIEVSALAKIKVSL